MPSPQSTRVPCPLAVLGCEKTFSRRADAVRHSNEKPHGGIDTSIYCPFPGCSWTSRRISRFEEHVKKHNVVLEVPADFQSATPNTVAQLYVPQIQAQGNCIDHTDICCEADGSSCIDLADFQSQIPANTSLRQHNPAATPVDSYHSLPWSQYRENASTYIDETDATYQQQAPQQVSHGWTQIPNPNPNSLPSTEAAAQLNPDSRGHLAASETQAGRSEVGGSVGDNDGFKQYNGYQGWRSHDHTGREYRYL